MSEDPIAEVGIDADERLYVRPSTSSFDHIYRAGMQVNWEPTGRRLFSPKPREWTYADWFAQIVEAVSGEYGTTLQLTSYTEWTNVPASLRAEIEAQTVA